MYSGTYGVAHDLGPLLEALRALPKGTPMRLVIQASGSRVEELRGQVADLPIPVEWREPVPRGRLVESLREGDAHVVSVRAGFERLVVPSKLYAPLALGIPVLLVGPEARRFAPRGARAAVPTGLPAALQARPGLSCVAADPAPRTRAAGLAAWLSLAETTARSAKEGAA